MSMQASLPFSHRLAVALVLRTSTVLEDLEAEIADRAVVTLGAFWPVDGKVAGVLKAWSIAFAIPRSKI
jgi:hypothetical protein